jgi:ubiquinone/menaquinone biosynthesis C-methylase UbiE
MTRKTTFLALIIALGCVALRAGPSAAQAPHTHDHSFAGAKKWAKVFDDPERDAWQKPHQVIAALGLKADAVIADIGAGTGYFTMRLAHMRPDGRIYGVDTEPDMVKYLAERARREGLKNVTAVHAAPGDPRLPEKADLILMVDVFHHVGERERYFRQLQHVLTAGGRVVIIDFRKNSPVGPPVRARIAPQQVKAELEVAGFALVQDYDFLPNQYFLIFAPAKR